MERMESTEETASRLRRIGDLLTRLSSNTRAIADVREAYEAGDARAFHAALGRVGFEMQLPPRECTTVIDVITRVVWTWERREVCRWFDRADLQPLELNEAGEAIRNADSSAQVRETLKGLKLVICSEEWVPVARLVTVERTAMLCGGVPEGPRPAPLGGS